MNIQGWYSLGLTGLTSLQSKGLWRVFYNTTVQKYQFFGAQLSLMVQHWHQYMTTGKTIAWIIWTFVGKVMSLLFNMLSRFVIAFLRRRKCLLVSWLQSPSSEILEPRKRKSAAVSTFSSSICHEVMGLDAIILVFCEGNMLCTGLYYNGPSLKNKNDFLITPQAGSSKKYIVERHLESKMLKYWCDWWKSISDYSGNQSLEGVAEKGHH